MTTDPREDRVRALLAGLPPETPPADVVTRLDETLDRLTRERSAGVADLGEHRTGRRRVPRVAFAAAAAVVLLGGGAVAAQQGLLTSRDSSTSAGASASRAESPGSARSPSAAPDPSAAASPGTGAGSTGLAPPSTPAAAAGVPALTSRAFAADVASLLRAPAGSAGARRAPGEDQGRDLARHQDDPGCSPPRTTPSARTRPVTLDGRPAVLVVGPLLDGTRTVSAWPCGSRTPAASAQVPASR